MVYRIAGMAAEGWTFVYRTYSRWDVADVSCASEGSCADMGLAQGQAPW